MKKFFAVAVLTLLATATIAVAQAGNSVVAEVPFPFLVGKVSLPAGTYQFAASANLEDIIITDTTTRKTIIASVITRLSPRSASEAMVVFDVADANHYLSEIYMPGMDGFQVPGSPAQHTHMSVKAHK